MQSIKGSSDKSRALKMNNEALTMFTRPAYVDAVDYNVLLTVTD